MASDIRPVLRAEVAKRAGQRCEYCLIHEEDAGFKHQIDHITSRKHGGTSTSENLALACVICNRHKGSDVGSVAPGPEGVIRLFHPRRDQWTDHFHLSGETIEARTDVGAATIRLLRLNAPERLTERRALQVLGRYPGSNA